MAEIEHQCPYCELRFAYRAEEKDHITHDHPEHQHVVEDLDPHELPHHGGDATIGVAVHAHQCPRCELRFAFTNELRDHIALEHENRQEHGSVTT